MGRGGTERPGRGRPSPAGRPAREAEPLGAGASLGSTFDADGAGAPVPVGAGAGDGGVPTPPDRPGEAEPEEGAVADVEGDRVGAAVGDGGVEEGGGAEAGGEVDGGGGGDGGDGAGLVPVAGGGAVVPPGLPGASTPYARSRPDPRGAAYSMHAQVNTQVSAGP